MIPQPYQLPAVVLILLGGVVAWVAGYRLFRLVLTLYGFILGALIGSSTVGTSDAWTLILAAVGGGIVGALIMFFGYFVGVALIGAGAGALVVHMVWSQLGTDPHPFIVVLAAVAGAAGAMALQRYVIIVVTAFAGAWTVLLGGLALTEQGRSLAVNSASIWLVYPMDPAPGRRWVFFAWIGLGLVGVAIQMGYTSRRRGKRKPPIA